MIKILLIMMSSLIIFSCAETSSSSKNGSSAGGSGGSSSGGAPTVNNKVFTLRWTPPLAFENNDILTPISDLSEYRIYYGDSVTNVTQNVEVISSNVSSFSTSSLDANLISTFATVNLAMTAVSKDGVESSLSQIVTFSP